jgi:hypothetical protein
MSTDVVQFRFASAELEFLRKEGLNPNEFAKEAFEEGLRMLRARVRSEQIESIRRRIKIVPGTDFAAVVREDRDSR